jgi:hypothetical protein
VPKAENIISKKSKDVHIEIIIEILIPFPKFFCGFSTFLPDVKILSNPANVKNATLNACVKLYKSTCDFPAHVGKLVLACINIKQIPKRINAPPVTHLMIPLHFEIFLKYLIPIMFNNIIDINKTIPIRSKYKLVKAPQSCTLKGILFESVTISGEKTFLMIIFICTETLRGMIKSCENPIKHPNNFPPVPYA